ncbi:MAG TPA: hypothetical protein VGI06_08035, partial [Acidimicrobiales bacterium]
TVLATAARRAGAPVAVVAAATETATARHFFDACLAHGAIAPLTLLCAEAAGACRAHSGDALAVEVVMVDFECGAVITRAACP